MSIKKIMSEYGFGFGLINNSYEVECVNEIKRDYTKEKKVRCAKEIVEKLMSYGSYKWIENIEKFSKTLGLNEREAFLFQFFEVEMDLLTEQNEKGQYGFKLGVRSTWQTGYEIASMAQKKNDKLKEMYPKYKIACLFDEKDAILEIKKNVIDEMMGAVRRANKEERLNSLAKDIEKEVNEWVA